MNYWPLFETLTSILLVQFVFVAFCFGSRTMLAAIARVSALKEEFSLFHSGSFVLLSTLGLTALLSVFGLKSLWLTSTFCIITCLFGIRGLITRTRDDKSELFWLSALLLSNYFWIALVGHIEGLPSNGDGAIHTTFFGIIGESGQQLLSRNSFSFSDSFGSGSLPYYPTGTHVVGWVLSLPLKILGYTDAVRIKAVFISACAGGALIAVKELSQAFKSRSVSKLEISLILVILTTYFRFPLWAADSGGYSRIIAQVLAIPLIVGVVNRRQALHKLDVYLTPFVMVALYFCHPTAAFGYSWAWGVQAMMYLGTCFYNRRINSKALLSYFVMATLGGVILGVFVSRSGLGVVPTLAVSEFGGRQEFSWTNLIFGRWRELLEGIFLDSFSRVTVPSFLSFKWLNFLSLLGLIGSVFLVRNHKESRQFFVYSLLTFLMIFAVSSLVFVDYSIAVWVGLIFYNETARISELAFISILFFLFMGTFVLQSVVTRLAVLVRLQKYESKIFSVALTVCIAMALNEGFFRFSRIQKHFQYWLVLYKSPSKEEGGVFTDFVRKNTPANSLIITLEDEFLWSPAARTGRRFLYQAGECPTMNKSKPLPCENRKSYLAKVKSNLENIDARAFNSENCGFEEFLKINRNVFLAINKDRLSYREGCSELESVASDNNFILLKVKI